jgi:hypothetical protein
MVVLTSPLRSTVKYSDEGERFVPRFATALPRLVVLSAFSLSRRQREEDRCSCERSVRRAIAPRMVVKEETRSRGMKERAVSLTMA